MLLQVVMRLPDSECGKACGEDPVLEQDHPTVNLPKPNHRTSRLTSKDSSRCMALQAGSNYLSRLVKNRLLHSLTTSLIKVRAALKELATAA